MDCALRSPATMRVAACLILAMTAAGDTLAYAAERTMNAAVKRPQVEDSGTVVVRLPSSSGFVAKADILAELGAVGGIDLRAVEWLLPEGQLDLKQAKTERRLKQLNRVVGRYVVTRISRHMNRDPELVIEFDRARLNTDKRRAKVRAKTVSLKVLDPRGTLRAQQQYGLIMDDSADQLADRQFVVGIHGFNGGPDAMTALLDPLRAAGRPCASFVYPNDQAIADSAALLSRELKALARREPRRRVALVAFSMGGLVARAALENPELDPGNVERLIMIAPPNQGTICARYSRGFDLYEHVYRQRQFEPRRWLVASMLDGLGEARNDLCPDSAFLRQLNARPRNKSIRYSILLGKGGELDQRVVDRVARSIDRLQNTSTWARVFAPKLDRIRSDLSELTEPSDGFVTVRRGRLPGVDDVCVLRFGHVEAFEDLHDEGVVNLHQAIATRLETLR
jgi:pimeloyl-ACP methyl ester carboxylesterase